MNTRDWLDAAKRSLGVTSDYALAKALGITDAAVSALRNGKSAMSIETANKIAKITGKDGHQVYSDGQSERAKSDEIRQFWAGISEKFSMGFEWLLSGAGPCGIRTSAS